MTIKTKPPFARVLQNHYFTDHCWLEKDKLAACTAEGEIIILENYELKQHIENAFNNQAPLMGKSTSVGGGDLTKQNQLQFVSCIKAYSKGFFIAADNGTMALWVRSEENQQTSGK